MCHLLNQEMQSPSHSPDASTSTLCMASKKIEEHKVPEPRNGAGYGRDKEEDQQHDGGAGGEASSPLPTVAVGNTRDV